MDVFFGLSTGEIVTFAIGMLFSTILFAIFKVSVPSISTILYSEDTETGKRTLNYLLIILFLLITTVIFFYFPVDIGTFVHSTPFFAVFDGIVCLYICIFIIYFKILKQETRISQKYNFLFLFLLSVGIFLYLYSSDFIFTFNMQAGQLIVLELIAFGSAFYIFYKRINSSFSSKENDRSKSVKPTHKDVSLRR